MELPRGDMIVTDHTENLNEYFEGSSSFGDDDFSQLDFSDDYSDGQADFDDACQLPAEELKKRLSKLGKQIKLGSQFADADDSSAAACAMSLSSNRIAWSIIRSLAAAESPRPAELAQNEL